MTCPRCGGYLYLTEIILGSPALSCLNCGELIDDVVLVNRTPERRAYWKKRTDQEWRELSRAEKVLREYEPEAIRLSF